jgi:hypothetical protein
MSKSSVRHRSKAPAPCPPPALRQSAKPVYGPGISQEALKDSKEVNEEGEASSSSSRPSSHPARPRNPPQHSSLSTRLAAHQHAPRAGSQQAPGADRSRPTSRMLRQQHAAHPPTPKHNEKHTGASLHSSQPTGHPDAQPPSTPTEHNGTSRRLSPETPPHHFHARSPTRPAMATD